MRIEPRLALCGLALLFSPVALLADTVVIAGNPNAPTSNFANPGNTATSGYTINTSGNGTSVIIALTTADLSAPDFANLYFETVANDVTMGSNLGFEASGTAVNDAFNPNTGQKYSTALAGFSSTETFSATSKTITITIPDTFFSTIRTASAFPKRRTARTSHSTFHKASATPLSAGRPTFRGRMNSAWQS